MRTFVKIFDKPVEGEPGNLVSKARKYAKFLKSFKAFPGGGYCISQPRQVTIFVKANFFVTQILNERI